MSKKVLLAVLGVALIGGAALIAVADSSWLKGTTDEKFNTLAEIQPGLGTVMIEYSNRMGNIYYAAQAKNWGMAAYQLKEALEMQEVGETTRPARAPLLKAFEQSLLRPLGKDIVNQDSTAFQTDFNSMVNGCNACHTGAGFRYIVYKLPSQPVVPAKLDTGDTFTKEELEELLKDLLGK